MAAGGGRRRGMVMVFGWKVATLVRDGGGLVGGAVVMVNVLEEGE